MNLQDHYLNSALTYKYRLLESNVIIAERNYYSKETYNRENAIFESFKDTLNLLGYKYNSSKHQVEKI